MAARQSLGGLNLRQMQDMLSPVGLWSYPDASGLVGAADNAMWRQENDLSALNGYSFDTNGSTESGDYTMNVYGPSGAKLNSKQYKNITPGWLGPATMLALAGMGAGAFGAFSGAAGTAGTAAGTAEAGAGLFGEGLFSALPAAETAGGLTGLANGASAGLGALEAGSAGLFSSLPAWETAGGLTGLGNGASAGLSGGIGTLGESLLAPAAQIAPETLPLTGTAPTTGFASTSKLPALAGSGLMGNVGSLLKSPDLLRLIGGAAGGLFGGDGAPGPQSSAYVPGKMAAFTPPTPLPDMPSVGLDNGLGSKSAGLFDEYMKRNRVKKGVTFNAPTFGSGG